MIDPYQLGLHANDVGFAQQIERLGKFLDDGDNVMRGGSRICQTTAQEDFIATDARNHNWSLLKCINFALLLTIAPNREAALVASVRNEGLSILEWIAHHRTLGFDDIFIYTNNNTDGSTELLRLLAEHHVIYLIENEVGDAVSPQIKGYEHSLHFLPELRNYRWVCYLDADEFLISRCEPELDLHSLLRAVAAVDSPNLDAVLFNWKWFGSENAYDRTEGLLLNRFRHSIHNNHVKTLARTNAILSMWPLHVPVMPPNSVTVNSLLQPVRSARPEINPCYGLGQINHYWNKSFEEFALKQSRGRGAVGLTGEQRNFETFFSWGNNGTRGNYDPPIESVLGKLCAEYNGLLALDGVGAALTEVRIKSQAELNKLNENLDLRRLYANRGKFKD